MLVVNVKTRQCPWFPPSVALYHYLFIKCAAKRAFLSLEFLVGKNCSQMCFEALFWLLSVSLFLFKISEV